MISFKTFNANLRPLASLALVSLLGVGLSACSEAKTETVEAIRPVKVVEIASMGTTRELDYSGAVKARTEMNLGFRVAGKITERVVNIGDKVKSGDLLARIDATDYQLGVSTAEANLQAAEKQVETARLVDDRAAQLFAKKFASEAQREQASLAYKQASSQRDAALSSLRQARNQVGYAELRADQNGIVTSVNADSGQVVGAGTPVVAVAVDGDKEVQIAVPELEIAQFQPGKPVKVSFWSDDKLVLDGTVREVAGSADAQSRTFSVRVSLPDDNRVLLGMSATIEASVNNGKEFVSIPLSALAKQDGKDIVWVVNDEQVHARGIKVASFADAGVQVADGLKPGDIVVAAGTQFMAENLKVKLPTPEQRAASNEATAAIR
ncbi:efflux RND transporter periplasmic adaptor subunit [Aminobacter carboxidus]|uniref:Efflux RND transporter periplasmic adaptor subunit n=1 Tax=Aminobacter carboxidus TaxID=376165 RepID=A0A8E1W9J9_9HYPH|nr:MULTISPECIES: efflux RND transporter periplasmic adaptor subunit [Aminobacter carboxidus group]MBB6464267.1 RND family efflux transporter MFP subunit [Aminobacter lissarensis]MBE1207803.1 efflux RND transporter periplasmic adaptor subunit [Aminobacter carboxidus]